MSSNVTSSSPKTVEKTSTRGETLLAAHRYPRTCTAARALKPFEDLNTKSFRNRTKTFKLAGLDLKWYFGKTPSSIGYFNTQIPGIVAENRVGPTRRVNRFKFQRATYTFDGLERPAVQVVPDESKRVIRNNNTERTTAARRLFTTTSVGTRRNADRKTRDFPNRTTGGRPREPSENTKNGRVSACRRRPGARKNGKKSFADESPRRVKTVKTVRSENSCIAP